MLANILRPPPVIARTLVFAALLGAWELASVAGHVSRFIAPPPSEIFPAIATLFTDNDLVAAFLRTFGEVLAAAAIGSLLGMIVGWWLHHDKTAGRAFTDWIAATAAAPLVLLFPLFLVLFGRSSLTIIVMSIITGLAPIVIKTTEGLLGVRPVLMNVGKSLKLTDSQMFWKILMPAALPVLFSGIRLSWTFVLISVVGIEFLINLGGLGQLINDLAERYDMPGTYAAISFVIIVSVVFFMILERVETWLRPRN